MSLPDGPGHERGWTGFELITYNIVGDNDKTSQELRMLSSVTINCQVAKIVMKPGSQLSVL